MGRELQKKKNRSSLPKIRLKPKSKHVHPLGNAIIAANWDSAKTLSQNYRRLGLTSRLNSITGGTEVAASKTSTASKLAIHSALPTTLAPTEARVERDASTGKIIRVIRDHDNNPLHDPLNSDDEDLEMEEAAAGGVVEGREIINQLEEQAAMIPEKKVRKQSEREKDWIERLVRRYGDDFSRMARDRKLNPMQQTEADISRRVQKWRSEGRVVEAEG